MQGAARHAHQVMRSLVRSDSELKLTAALFPLAGAWVPAGMPKCKFGADCVRQNALHFRTESHPATHRKVKAYNIDASGMRWVPGASIEGCHQCWCDHCQRPCPCEEELYEDCECEDDCDCEVSPFPCDFLIECPGDFCPLEDGMCKRCWKSRVCGNARCGSDIRVCYACWPDNKTCAKCQPGEKMRKDMNKRRKKGKGRKKTDVDGGGPSGTAGEDAGAPRSPPLQGQPQPRVSDVAPRKSSRQIQRVKESLSELRLRRIKEEPVAEYDGSYECLICSESVRGTAALQCTQCQSNPVCMA